MIATVNPANGQTIQEFAALTADEIESRLQRASDAFAKFRRTTFASRSSRLSKAADILDADREKLARLITLEMGKPITASRAEVAKCATVCRYYAEHGERFLADESFDTGASKSFVRYQPLGAVLAIMPWNFPFWQVFRFAAPALAAGNVGLLKHASNVPQCSLAIEDIFVRAGFDNGEFQSLLIGAKQVDAVIADDRVKAVTLTGSEPAGISVAIAAGKAIKKVVLELGGSDPFIVMPSADLDRAIEIAVKARTVNSGQSCIAAKRFIVHESIAAEFEKRFAETMQKLKVGDPMLDETEVGPLASEQILDDLDRQVSESVAAGARAVTGCFTLEGDGHYYAPSVLADIPKSAPAYYEELFGPVATLFRVASAEEAIEVANDTVFGLGASAWTSDESERELFANEIESGQVFINAMVASDPRVPFGGVKRSGYGRELGPHGIREFVNAKTIWIEEGKPRQKAVE